MRRRKTESEKEGGEKKEIGGKKRSTRSRGNGERLYVLEVRALCTRITPLE